MADNSNLKVQTFDGINDIPIEPTITTAGNGSHLIKLHNDLVDEHTNRVTELISRIEELENNSNNFTTILKGDSPLIYFFMATKNDLLSKIIVKNQPGNSTLEFYLDDNPFEGGTITNITGGYEIAFANPYSLEAGSTIHCDGDEFGTNEIEVTLVMA